MLTLPVLLAIVLFVTSLNLMKNNKDTNIELQGADRVLKFVFNNLDDNPVLDILQKSAGTDCPKNYGQFSVGLW